MKTVAHPIFPYVLTCPAGTTPDAPFEIVIPIDNLILDAVDLQIPNGHVGMTGFALWYGPAIVLPWTSGTGWISGDDLRESFTVGLEVGPTPLTARLYNLGTYEHSFYTRLRCSYLPLPAAGAPTLQLITDTEQLAA